MEFRLLTLKVLKKGEIDDIHDLRVASRRLRVFLELFEPLLHGAQIKPVSRTIRKMTGLLGKIRNIDEAALFFESCINSGIPADFSLIPDQFEKMRSHEIKRIRKRIGMFEKRRIDAELKKIAASLNEKNISIGSGRFSIIGYFSEHSIKRYQTVNKFLPASTVSGNRKSRHKLRIAVKKWRYLIEAIAEILECDCRSILEKLREYQSVLGRMNDIVEFAALLDSLGIKDDERVFLISRLASEEEILMDRFNTLLLEKPLRYRFFI